MERLNIKLYPTEKQKVVLNNHFNGYRFAYNLCLDYKSTMWKHHRINKSGYDMASELFEIRRETPWLADCKAECIREAALEVDKSFKNFFQGKGYPKFKSKYDKQSFHAYQNISCVGSRLKFYKQKIKFMCSEKYLNILNENKIKQVTFKRDACGDYWASCLVDIKPERVLPKTDKVVGIDLGIKDLVVTSDGDRFENKRYFTNSQDRLAVLQRRASRKKKGSNNRNKARIKVAKLHRKITRQREWYYHQISNQLLRENQTVVVETLRVKNMMGNKKLSKHIADASWSTLVNMLEYKAKWYGRDIVKVDTFYPSSKTCSDCGNVKEQLLLSERTYDCEYCGLSIDRDHNAAINLRNSGIKTPGEPAEVRGYAAVETGSNTLTKKGV